MQNQEKFSDKFFIQFPEFFAHKNYDIDFFMNINLGSKEPRSIDIIFTRSKKLRKIRGAAKKYAQEIKGIPGIPKLSILRSQNIYEQLKFGEPSSFEFMPKLEFRKGEPDFEIDKTGKILRIFVEEYQKFSIIHSNPFILFFPADDN